MANNGWYSVYEPERPESREEVLTLSYAGDFPAPLDLFGDPAERVYEVCTYFYPGDRDENEVPGDPATRTPTTFEAVIFEKEGFYCQAAVGPRGGLVWRRIKTIDEGMPRGIICWKRMDHPTPD